MKLSRLISRITFMCVALAVLCFGAYAAVQKPFTLKDNGNNNNNSNNNNNNNNNNNGEIVYTVDDALADIHTQVYSCSVQMDTNQMYKKIDEIMENAQTAYYGLSLQNAENTLNYNSKEDEEQDMTKNCSFIFNDGNNPIYTYFVVIEVSNINPNTNSNIWVDVSMLQDLPENINNCNSGICTSIGFEQSKKFVIALGVEDITQVIQNEQGQAIDCSLQIDIGSGECTRANNWQLSSGAISPKDKSLLSGKVVIPSYINGEKITAIDNSAFAGCTEITSINSNKEGEFNLNGTIKNISTSAFFGCTHMTSLYIPNSVTLIGNTAFGDCTALESAKIYGSEVIGGVSSESMIFKNCNSLANVTIGGTVSIGWNAFYGLGGLKNLFINNSVSGSVGTGAFAGCTNLETVRISNHITDIDDGAFSGCVNLYSLTLPYGITYLGNNCFDGCSSLSGTFVIPDSVTNICEETFKNCTGITNFVLGSGLTTLAGENFYNTGVVEVVIPENITSLGEKVFYNCLNLQKVTILADLTSIGKDCFNKCERLGKVEIYDATPATLGQDAFYCNRELNFFDGEGTVCWRLPYSIFVSKSAISAYKADWSNIASESRIYYHGSCVDTYYEGLNSDVINEIPFISTGFDNGEIWKNILAWKWAINFKIGNEIVEIGCSDPGCFFGDTEYMARSLPEDFVLDIPASVHTISSGAFECFERPIRFTDDTNFTEVNFNSTYSITCDESCNTYENGKYFSSENNPYLIMYGLITNNVQSVVIHGNTKIVLELIMGMNYNDSYSQLPYIERANTIINNASLVYDHNFIDLSINDWFKDYDGEFPKVNGQIDTNCAEYLAIKAQYGVTKIAAGDAGIGTYKKVEKNSALPQQNENLQNNYLLFNLNNCQYLQINNIYYLFESKKYEFIGK